MYFTRDIEHQLNEALKQFPACLITGSRQSGKSTLLQHSLPNYRYVTLDNPIMRALAVEDPELFLSSYPSPLIIDEIQYAPNLLFYLKMRIDQNRQLRGQFVFTGSQTFQVMKGVSESLAGRIAIFQLYPFLCHDLVPTERIELKNSNSSSKRFRNTLHYLKCLGPCKNKLSTQLSILINTHF